jgi:hypothetical protein
MNFIADKDYNRYPVNNGQKEAVMSDPTTDVHPISDRSGVTDGVRAQILAAEHWDLLATRSMTWNQIFSRASMFITMSSAIVVALALVAQATNFDSRFRIFALLVLPVLLVLGIATFIHLGEANGEDIKMVIGMNRLRRAYLDLAPELRPYFPPVYQEDSAVFPLSNRGGILSTLFIFIGSTPSVIATINVIVAGVIVAILADALGLPGVVSVLGAVAAGLVVALGQARIVFNRVSHFKREVNQGITK